MTPTEQLVSVISTGVAEAREAIALATAHIQRTHDYRQWLVDRIAWLKYEMDHGGDWKYLNLKREETAYCLEKFDAITKEPT